MGVGDSLEYIWGRINYRFLNLHWVFMWPLILLEVMLWPSVKAVMLGMALAYWLVYAWPRRWLFHAVLGFFLLMWLIQLGIGASPWHGLLEHGPVQR